MALALNTRELKWKENTDLSHAIYLIAQTENFALTNKANLITFEWSGKQYNTTEKRNAGKWS